MAGRDRDSAKTVNKLKYQLQEAASHGLQVGDGAHSCAEMSVLGVRAREFHVYVRVCVQEDGVMKVLQRLAAIPMTLELLQVSLQLVRRGHERAL